jgi:hypothetical protein
MMRRNSLALLAFMLPFAQSKGSTRARRAPRTLAPTFELSLEL